MSDHHYHANHIDAPARGSKAVAMQDARRLNVIQSIYDDSSGWLVHPLVSAESLREHGAEFPRIVKCRRPDCSLVRA